VGLLAVALDEAQAVPNVRAASQDAPGVPVALGNEAVGNAYTILNHYLFVGKEDLRLPSAFLLNAKGEIVRAYRQTVAAAQVVADAAKIEAPEAERLARAVPFAGTFSSKPGDRNYLQYGIELVEQGLESSALPAFERVQPPTMTRIVAGLVVLGLGKTPEQIAAIANEIVSRGSTLLVTRAPREAYEAVRAVAPASTYHEIARVITLEQVTVGEEVVVGA
jgi:hypothetical protein